MLQIVLNLLIDYCYAHLSCVRRDSSVDIATGYGLDNPGIASL
jgi:hypothetical protein